MSPRFLLPLLWLGLTVPAPALDDAGKKAGEDLLASLREHLQTITANDLDGNRGYPVKQLIRQLQTALASGNNRQILQALDGSNAFSSGPPFEAMNALRDALVRERETRIAESAASLNALFESARATLLEADGPEQLDALLASLSQPEPRSSYDEDSAAAPQLQKLVGQLANTRQFVLQWQDYLQARKAGNRSQAVQALQNIAQRDNPLLPRSKVLARLEAERSDTSSLDAILDRITTLESMKPAIAELTAAVSGRYGEASNTGSRDALTVLSTLEKTYRDFEAGLPVNLEVLYLPSPYESSTATRPAFSTVRAALLKKVLPRYLGLPADQAAGPDESVDQFLNRLLAEATARADGAAARRIASTLQLMAKTSRFNGADLKALQDFAAGTTQLAAGQFELAVISLQCALRAGSDLIPAAKTGALLDGIRRGQPEAYERGMAGFLAMPHPADAAREPLPRDAFFPPHSRVPYRGTSVVLPVPPADSPPPAPEDNGE